MIAEIDNLVQDMPEDGMFKGFLKKGAGELCCNLHGNRRKLSPFKE